MDYRKLLLSPHGRIRRWRYWRGGLILTLAGMVLVVVPIVGVILAMALAYPWGCLFSKRLHDLGHSGWRQVIFWSSGGMVVLAGLLGARWPKLGLDGLLSAIWIGAIIGLITAPAFMICLGVFKSQPLENRYGPAPGEQETVDEIFR